jgi:hypothetical protein
VRVQVFETLRMSPVELSRVSDLAIRGLRGTSAHHMNEAVSDPYAGVRI